MGRNVSRVESRFEVLYHRYHRPVLAYCLRRTSTELAHQAANETFTIAWRRSSDVPQGEEALPWLYGVARRVLAHQRRSTARFARLVTRAALVRRPQPIQPETVIVQQHEYAAVLEAIGRLRPDEREMLLLSAWEGLSHAEIAAITGYTLATVDKRIARAKKRLLRRFEAVILEGPHSRSATTAAGGDV